MSIDLSSLADRPEIGSWSALLAFRGSIAHGTYVPSNDPDSYDDKDLIGIAIPPIDYYVGLKEFGSRGTVEIKEGDLDIVVYEHRKTLRLLSKGNPNVLSMLWLPQERYLHKTDSGRVLLDSRQLFSTKTAYPAFRGYAKGQLNKMFKRRLPGIYGAKRKELLDRYGYDVKQASHLIRILRQGIEFMDTGKMTVDRSDIDADELITVKNGEMSLPWVEKESRRLDDELECAGRRSTLPEQVDRSRVNALAVDMWRGSREW